MAIFFVASCRRWIVDCSHWVRQVRSGADCHIAENDGGSLTRRKRLDSDGAQARLVLPVNVESGR